jgi:SAM-dependent methyltransferase
MFNLHSEVRNSFGKTTPSIACLLESLEVSQTIRDTLTRVLAYLGLPEPEAAETAESVIQTGQRCLSDSDYELQAYTYLQAKGIIELLPTKRKTRLSLIFDQIRSFIPLDCSVLDIGCGDGGLGKLIAGLGNRVSLCDVYENPSVSSAGLPFSLFSQGRPLPFKGPFNVALLSSVLHHCDDPVALIADCARILDHSGRLIVIESVYGIDATDGNNASHETAFFLSLEHESQRASSIFFDHLCNRVFRYSPDPWKKVNVPFNFNTPSGWNNLLGKLVSKRHRPFIWELIIPM